MKTPVSINAHIWSSSSQSISVYSTRHAEVRQAVLSGMAAFPVDLAEVIAGTRVGVAGMDDFFNDVVKGTGSCRTSKEIRSHGHNQTRGSTISAHSLRYLCSGMQRSGSSVGDSRSQMRSGVCPSWKRFRSPHWLRISTQSDLHRYRSLLFIMEYCNWVIGVPDNLESTVWPFVPLYTWAFTSYICVVISGRLFKGRIIIHQCVWIIMKAHGGVTPDHEHSLPESSCVL